MRTFFMIHMGFQGLESLYFHTPIDHSAVVATALKEKKYHSSCMMLLKEFSEAYCIKVDDESRQEASKVL